MRICLKLVREFFAGISSTFSLVCNCVNCAVQISNKAGVTTKGFRFIQDFSFCAWLSFAGLAFCYVAVHARVCITFCFIQHEFDILL